MFSRSSRRLLLPRLGLFAMGVILPAACAAGAPTSAPKPAADAPGASAKGVVRAESASPTPAASDSSGATAGPASLAGSAIASGSASNGSPAATVYGLSAPELLGWSPAEQVQQLEAMKATGITSVRVDAKWSEGQPDGPDSYDWTALDQVVASIQKVGLSADLIIDGCPRWAAVSGAQGNQFAQPASPAAFANWAAAVAKRYDGKGAKYFEIWNEPNNPSFWAPRPDPAAYTADLKAAYAAIKNVDPSAIVLSGGLAPEPNSSTSYAPLTFLADMYADGARGSFDGVGFHPYSYPIDPDTFNPGSAWSQMSQTSPSIRSIMAANGDSVKKIWITEFGAPTSGTTDNASYAEQSEELVQAISQVKQLSWIGSFYIYTWSDLSTTPAADNGFGLITDNAQKPAYAAVVTALHS